jgi:hypothetical protein
MQFPELVYDSGFGRPADLPPVALPVPGVSQRYLAAPQPWTMPVAFRVPARTAVLEGDPIFTAPAPGGHGDRLARSGDYRW